MWINSFEAMDNEEFERVMRRVGDGFSFVKSVAQGEIKLTKEQREALANFVADFSPILGNFEFADRLRAAGKGADGGHHPESALPGGDAQPSA